MIGGPSCSPRAGEEAHHRRPPLRELVIRNGPNMFIGLQQSLFGRIGLKLGRDSRRRGGAVSFGSPGLCSKKCGSSSRVPNQSEPVPLEQWWGKRPAGRGSSRLDIAATFVHSRCKR